MEQTKEPVAEFRVNKNGPLQVSGSFTITGPDGEIIPSGEVAFLCRCGGSKNKPFCDGSHRKVVLKNKRES